MGPAQESWITFQNMTTGIAIHARNTRKRKQLQRSMFVQAAVDRWNTSKIMTTGIAIHARDTRVRKLKAQVLPQKHHPGEVHNMNDKAKIGEKGSGSMDEARIETPKGEQNPCNPDLHRRTRYCCLAGT